MAAIIACEAGTIPEDKQSLIEALEQKFDQANAELIRQAAKLHQPLFAERAEITKGIKGFWHQALVNCMGTSIYIDDDDHALLAHITDIKVHRDLADPRAATIEFFFEDNEFINDASLKKEYKLADDASPLGDKFEFHEHTVPQKTTISWKSDDKNLAKRKPTKEHTSNGKDDLEDDDDDFEPGSFFSSLFESTSKHVAGVLGENIVDELFQNALAFYLNQGTDDTFTHFDDDDDDEDEDDDDDAAEIDLEAEEPAKKKPKQA
ncbi:hypothetical protein OC835_004153 [Tilletia horrida]|nr:hypothetical protein OC835_004153 [Tilletia horrida]